MKTWLQLVAFGGGGSGSSVTHPCPGAAKDRDSGPLEGRPREGRGVLRLKIDTHTKQQQLGHTIHRHTTYGHTTRTR